LSLTSFLRIHEVREAFAQQFPLPKFDLKSAIKAPPVTNHYPLIGTAFDYLLRFYVGSLNADTSCEGWVAELAVKLTRDNPSLYKKTSAMLKEARREYLQFKQTKEITPGIIKATILLAQLDPIYRANVIDPNLGKIEDGDVQDLQNLIKAVDTNLFVAKSHCFLNPTFGLGSELVHGADSDMIIDRNLIDIKTTKNLEFSRDYFNQLIGYYILQRIGKDSEVSKIKLQNLSIYYSRFATLYSIPVKTIEGSDNFFSFVKWFKQTADCVFSVPPSRRDTVLRNLAS